VSATILLIGSRGSGQQLEALLGECAAVVVYSVELQKIEPLLIENSAAPDIKYDSVVFISRNAVIYGLEYTRHLFPEARCFAVGPSTGSLLIKKGIHCEFPQKGSSEALLALPLFRQNLGRNILIVRGTGGRETLKSELEATGFSVDYLEVYQRVEIGKNAHDLCRMIDEKNVEIIVVRNGEVLAILSALMENNQYTRAASKRIDLIVPSIRVKNLAIGLNFSDVYVSDGAEMTAVASAIKNIMQRRHQDNTSI